MGGKNAGESEVARARRAGSAPPRWRVHESHARPHPPGRPTKQAVPPGGEDARNKTGAAHKQTSETRLQADATAHLGNNIGPGGADYSGNERPGKPQGERARGPQTEIEGQDPEWWEGARRASRNGSAERSAPRLPRKCWSAASGTRLQKRRNCVCARWICWERKTVNASRSGRPLALQMIGV